MIYYYLFFDGAPLISFARSLTAGKRASCGSPVRLPAPCTPASHATLGWTYSPFELPETKGGFGLGSDRALSRIWHLRFCDRLRLTENPLPFVELFDFHRLNERYKAEEITRSSQQHSILGSAGSADTDYCDIDQKSNQARDESPNQG